MHLSLSILTLLPAKHQGNFVIAIDSTGIKVTNRGDWKRKKHGNERMGYIKLHAAVNPATGLVTGLTITEENVHDSQEFSNLLEQSQKLGTVTNVKADGAYDSSAIYDELFTQGIQAAIPVRKNS